MRKLGIHLGGYQNPTPGNSLRIAHDVGFDCFFAGIRPEVTSGEISELAAKLGMEFENIHAPAKFERCGINPIWKPGEDGDYVMSQFMETIDVCHDLEIKKTVVHLSAGEKAPIPSDIGIDRFSRIVEYAVKKDVVVVMENQRKIGNLAVLLEKFKDEPYVGFCYDVGHEYCFTPGMEFMNMFGSMLTCTHVQDNMGVYNQDLHMLPFDGKVDFNKFAEQINRYGYKGSLMLEVVRDKAPIYKGWTDEQFITCAYERAVRLRKLVDGE